jgi:hypothetical protein
VVSYTVWLGLSFAGCSDEKHHTNYIIGQCKLIDELQHTEIRLFIQNGILMFYNFSYQVENLVVSAWPNMLC